VRNDADASTVTRTAAAGGSATGAATGISATDRRQITELAREFESYFVLQMVRQMRQSMLEDEHGEGLGAETMTETMDVELARQLAGAGGIGLQKVLQTAIERQVGGGSAYAPTAGGRAFPLEPAASAAASFVEPSPASSVASAISRTSSALSRTSASSRTAVDDVALEAAVPLPVSGQVSSAYGWRTDPFNGRARFHSGVDIAAAYGREVPAVGDGRVVFAGEQGGYGNTVVVEHAGGVRTRYAHLSSVQVSEGQDVASGTVVGRVGSSGRSTGPHLHFEVLQDGRAVDPAVAATRYAGQLKLEAVVADLPHSQPSVLGVAVGVDDESSGQ
jgi:peptidoglycan hydrolase FlgJ